MQTMKRLLAFALALTMVFALAACGGSMELFLQVLAGGTEAK